MDHGAQIGPHALQDVPLSAEPFCANEYHFSFNNGAMHSVTTSTNMNTQFLLVVTHIEMLQRTHMCRIHSNKIRKNRLGKKQYRNMEQQGNAKEIVILRI